MRQGIGKLRDWKKIGRDVEKKIGLESDKKGTGKERMRETEQEEMKMGTVYLVGGGPGDPGLITVKGLQAIREADCIVYDRLSSPELLLEAKPECELIYVGKASHNHTMKQEEINQLLVDKAGEYEKTIRLKGGDVYVFGRGGEEALELERNHVPFEVIPGISSSIAGLAYAGIPVTHRGLATGFHVVTAHNRQDELADIDFEAMAKGKDTCVFLMGLGKVKEIATKLMEAGMKKGTMAAVISCATTQEQRTVTAELSNIADEVKRAELPSPALIVVGDVVKLREKLNFFEQKKQFGKRYLVPKIGNKTSKLTMLLQQQGAMVEEIQVGEIVSGDVSFAKEELQQADWLLFTSRNGAECFFEALQRQEIDVRSLAHCRIASIGRKTTEALGSYGIYADLQPKEYHSDALIETLREQVKQSETVWYLKAENADGHIREALKDVCQFREVVIYENRAVKPRIREAMDGSAYDGICFTCASSAERLLSHVPKEVVAEWEKQNKLYSIGIKTTEYLNKNGIMQVRQAEHATYESLISAILEK